MSDKWYKGQNARKRRQSARTAHEARRKANQKTTSAIVDLIRKQTDEKEGKSNL